MINGIKNWFRRNILFIFPNNQKVVESQAKPSQSNLNKTYLIDATRPELTIESAIPTNTYLPMTASGESGGGYPLGTSQQQAAGLKQIVNEALVYMSSKTSKKITKWASTTNLNLQARAGRDINAYYDRKALRFFYFPDASRKKTVYACDSRVVVSHEFGHAFLDIIRPDLWNIMADEVWAFHEAFADIVAVLNNLQYQQIIDVALKQTDDLKKSNVLTKFAVDMGIGLYNITGGSGGELKDCLRDLSIKFEYVNPSSLPKDGPDNILINESHSFSRVFSGMFYKILIDVANFYVSSEKLTLKSALVKARDIMTLNIINATIAAPANPRFFKSVCQEMLTYDKKTGGKLQTILYKNFVSWKILDPAIKILNQISYAEFIKNLNSNFEYADHGSIKVLKVGTTKTIKLSEYHGILAQSMNPLMTAEIEVASQSSYYFDENFILQDAIETSDSEAMDSALNCLNIIQRKNLLGDTDKSQFELVENKLLRTKIASCGCNKPNYCIPGSPEYQKPWKPKNNAGCVKCHNKNCQPRSCDCENPSPPAPPKLGCYTSIKSCNKSAITVGSRISRKVC
jgi:uncharacterized protein (DUF427 family)